ncbi:hypothetical protein [Croceimicrobium hydrocarbonivorans]|uniref:Uncharacterized protein n=1 Tax=Croceimicrobium hydrocarbonivorans TaxID=2761580 RepID=A0A7H0VFP6_9FLAO|nr:hypothetical protein [Croceimicrobium hydrocarbonivorans]QNR24544.1 hypothetical protein H4K34_01505 [Croceimicrobium hydrocarbonivorans]
MRRFILIGIILLGALKSFAQVTNSIDDFFQLKQGDTLFIDVYQECSRALGHGYRCLIFKEDESSDTFRFIYLKDFGASYYVDGKELSPKEKLAHFLSYDSDRVREGTISLGKLSAIKMQLKEIIETNNEGGGFSYHCANFLELRLDTKSFKKEFKYAIEDLEF